MTSFVFRSPTHLAIRSLRRPRLWSSERPSRGTFSGYYLYAAAAEGAEKTESLLDGHEQCRRKGLTVRVEAPRLLAHCKADDGVVVIKVLQANLVDAMKS